MEEEVWKPIKNYDKYEISNRGRARSWYDRHRNRRLEPKILKFSQGGKGCLHNNGYYQFNAKSPLDNKMHSLKVHREVARAFLPTFSEELQVNHIDGNKHNNDVTNLEMVTGQQNIQHAFKHGLIVVPSGEDNGRAKLTEEQVKQILELHLQGTSIRTIARQFNVAKSTIGYVCQRKTWKHID